MKGCQKRIIQIKNLRDGIFDEAYFILRENAAATTRSEEDMVKTAQRIMEENQITLPRPTRRLPRHLVSFFAGAAAAAAVWGLILLLW